jgi:hypothetical protein
VAPPEFHGTLVFFFPDFIVPIVNQEQIFAGGSGGAGDFAAGEGKNILNERGKRWVFGVMGHLKAGVTREQAIADLNSIGAGLLRSRSSGRIFQERGWNAHRGGGHCRTGKI